MARLETLERWTNDRLGALGDDPVALPERPRRALVGLDGDPTAESAAVWAHQIARQVHLVTVLPREGRLFRSAPETNDEAEQTARRRRRRVARSLERLRDRCPGAVFEHHERRGSPIRELSGAATAHDADLLAGGTRNPERTVDRAFGSVGESLLHHAPVSTLLSQGAPSGGPIVAGVGEDRASRLAAAWATAVAAWLDRPLVLAHAGRQPGLESFEADGPDATAQWIDWPPRLGFSRLVGDDPGALVVLGHIGAGAWMGSTAIDLARTTRASILVARPGAGLPEASDS